MGGWLSLARASRRCVGRITGAMIKGYIYILQNSKDGYYLGSTNNLFRRVGKHGRGNTQSTRYGDNWRLIFSQE